MTMKVESFDRADQLVSFVNTNALPAGQIVSIREVAGRWYLFYYS